MAYEVKAIFSHSAGFKPYKTLNWGSLFCMVLFALSIMQERVRPTEDISFMMRIIWNPKLGQFILCDLSILFPLGGTIIVKTHG